MGADISKNARRMGEKAQRYCYIHQQKKSSKSIYCIFILLVAGHNYLQYELSKYTAIHLAHSSESTLHSDQSLINRENIYISIVSYITVPCMLINVCPVYKSCLLTLLELEYCPTSFPVCIAWGSVSS